MTRPKLAFSHMGISVFDADRMAAFYQRLLGMEETDRGVIAGDRTIVFLSRSPTDHHQIALVSGRTAEETTVGQVSFRVPTLDDLRAMKAAAEADEQAGPIRQVTHGNAWSIYFKDPEGNGIEVFCDTPWHVQQPQGRPWDLSKSDAELRDWTQSEFEKEPGFGPIEAFYAERADRLRDR